MMISVTMWNIVFIYGLPAKSEWSSALSIPLNLTVASLMGCRLFRELKLGLLNVDGLPSDGALSSLVFGDLANISHRTGHEVELQTRHTGRADENLELGDHRSGS